MVLETKKHFVLLLLAFSAFSPAANLMYLSGPGLDYTSWNGALLLGPNHSLWGIRVGFKENSHFISSYEFDRYITRAGQYSPDRTYAQFVSDIFTIDWVKSPQHLLIAKVTSLKDDIEIVVEAYPAHHFTGKNPPPLPFVNPAVFQSCGNGIITGTSPSIYTNAGKTIITGGRACFEGRSIEIQSPSKGLDHFRLQALTVPEHTLSPEKSKQAGFDKYSASNACMTFTVKKGTEIFFAAAASDRPIDNIEIDRSAALQLIENVRQQYERHKLYGAGLFGQAAQPMVNQLLWTACYNPFEKRLFIPAGRPWMFDGGYNLWGWDENFCGAAALVSEEIAEMNITLAAGDERIGPYACWYAFCLTENDDLLKKNNPVYRTLYPPHNSELVKGGSRNAGVGKGMDDTPMREHRRGLGEMYSLDMSCIKAWNLEILAKMASTLGIPEDTEQYAQSRQTIIQKINETFWNEEAGIYRNRYVSGEWPVTESPTSFYPWLAGAPTAEISKRLLASLLDESKFWGKFVIPSLSKDDPQYGKPADEEHNGRIFPPYCYWRGAIWPPPNYLVYEGLKRARYDSVAAEFAAKTVTLWYENWIETGGFPENFNPQTGRKSEIAHKHQAWSVLFPMLGVKELIDVEIWSDLNTIRFGTLAEGKNELYNYAFRSHQYDLTIDPTQMILKRNNKPIFKAQPGRCVIRNFDPTGTKRSFEINTPTEQKIELYLNDGGSPAMLSVSSGQQYVNY